MTKQERIMELLERGKVVRLMDGRCENSFVDMTALTTLVQQKRVKVYEVKGVKMVRAYTAHELLALESAKVAELRAQLDALKQAAKDLIQNLPESEIELARDIWGHTNTNLVVNYRLQLAELLK